MGGGVQLRSELFGGGFQFGEAGGVLCEVVGGSGADGFVEDDFPAEETREVKFTVPGNPGDTFSYRKIADGKDATEQFFYDGKVDPGDARAWDISEGTAKAGDVITVKMLGRGGFSFRFTKK